MFINKSHYRVANPPDFHGSVPILRPILWVYDLAKLPIFTVRLEDRPIQSAISFSDTKNGWWGTSPTTWNFGPNWPHRFKNGDFQSIFAHSISALTPGEKSTIMTNRKSTTSFPMSLRWTAYVTPKPQKGAQKRKLTHFFSLKVYFSRRKSSAKFLCVKTFSSKV